MSHSFDIALLIIKCKVILMKRVVNPILSSEKGHFRDCPCNSEQIDSGKIDGNVELVHSQYSCILTS